MPQATIEQRLTAVEQAVRKLQESMNHRALASDHVVPSTEDGFRWPGERKPAPKGRRFPLAEFARRGQEIFEREIRPKLKGKRKSDFLAIEIETGQYEVHRDEMTASERLHARVPYAQIWMRRVGSKYARHHGGRPIETNS